MTKITGTYYLSLNPANDNGIIMMEIWEAPYFVPVKGGVMPDKYRVVEV